MSQDTDKYSKNYTTKDAARLLGVTPRTIQLWSESGVLNPRKTLGGHRRFTAADIDELKQQLQKPKKEDAHTRDLRILVIEDEPDLLNLYRYSISSWELPVQVKTASDGYQGLIEIGAWKPDIVFADIQMPKVDGVHMLKVITNLQALNDTVVIVVSALSKRDIEDRGGVPDGIPIFTKPIPFDKLEKIVRQRCEARIKSQK